MGGVTGGNTAEYMRDRLLEDIRELKTLYKSNEDYALIGRTKNLVEEAAKGGDETRESFEKALGVSIDDVLAIKDSSMPKCTPDRVVHELENKIRGESDIHIYYSIGRECYVVYLDHFKEWRGLIDDSFKHDGDCYFGENISIRLGNKSNGRHTQIHLRSNSGYDITRAVEKLVELREVPVGVY